MQVGTNGIISFGSHFNNYQAHIFPYSNGSVIYQSHVIAPYWTDNDARLNGRVSWEMYGTSDGQISTEIIAKVRTFIITNIKSNRFDANFVFVANWSQMHPFPAGEYNSDPEPYYDMVRKSDIASATHTLLTFTE